MTVIAERKLLYAVRGSNERKEFSIRIHAPYVVSQNSLNFPIGSIIAGCHVEINGLDAVIPEVYGADTLQAVNIASDVEAFLRRLEKTYDIFWISGDPYFGQ